MPPFHLFLALGPLSVYFLAIGRINLSRQPFMTTGVRDTLALALATSGLAIVGPLQLFLPEPAVFFLGPWVWLPLVTLYALCSILVALLMKPRLVVYNATVDQLRPVIESVASQLDPGRRWAGNSLAMPNLGVQLAIEPFPSMRNTQLVAIGGMDQNLPGWKRLESALRPAIRSVPVQSNPRGLSLMFFGSLMAALILYGLNRHPETLAQSLKQFLRM